MDELIAKIHELLRRIGREDGWSGKVDFFLRLAEDYSDEMTEALQKHEEK